jgi:hypothetical protein
MILIGEHRVKEHHLATRIFGDSFEWGPIDAGWVPSSRPSPAMLRFQEFYHPWPANLGSRGSIHVFLTAPYIDGINAVIVDHSPILQWAQWKGSGQFLVLRYTRAEAAR